MARPNDPATRTPLSRGRVHQAAVALADEHGIEALSMRRLAQDLHVVPMALYKHVSNKDELLDGMIDLVVGEIDPPGTDTEWRPAVRARILSARQMLLRHPWASQVIESRTAPTPAVLDYMNSMIGMFRGGGVSANLTHHIMHTLGSRILGFTQQLFSDSSSADPEEQAEIARTMAPRYPYIAEIALTASHEGDSVVGQGCDDQFEFEFALDLLLDGFERIHRA